jgi:polyhydroxyalkanoate synthase
MTASANTASSTAAALPPSDFMASVQTWYAQWSQLFNPALAPFSQQAFTQASAMPQPPRWSWPATAAPGALPSLQIPPQRLQQLQSDYMQECAALWQQAMLADAPSPQLHDRRFASEAWRERGPYAFAAAWYLLHAKYLKALAAAVETDAKTRERIDFAVEQFTAAAAPSNFLALNPDVHKAIVETKGESLRQGIMNMLDDLGRGRIRQSDDSRFTVGENLANTPGAVVMQNELLQLIQYTPRERMVYERPLLIVPPCINKYYILDLQPDNSLVRHALDAGHQVFMVSWRNPDASLAGKTWDDYVEQGVLAAIDAVREISGREQINTLGFCIGGTLLASALAVRAARGEQLASSLTLLTSMLDYSDTGMLDLFVDESYVSVREKTIGGKDGAPAGLMRGGEFASTFSLLRPNDLVWNYVVDNYLKGRTPPPFDLLYWNADSTNLPGPMYAWYMRNAYLENRLREPGGVTVCGTPLDFGAIAAPAFVYGSREDHIVPWQSAYASALLLKGERSFVLGASGHIAGVINPPQKNKRSYWSAPAGAVARLPEDPQAWLADAVEQPGSWWPAWSGWLAGHAGKRGRARTRPGSARFTAIEAAPGSYVMAPA